MNSCDAPLLISIEDILEDKIPEESCTTKSHSKRVVESTSYTSKHGMRCLGEPLAGVDVSSHLPIAVSGDGLVDASASFTKRRTLGVTCRELSVTPT